LPVISEKASFLSKNQELTTGSKNDLYEWSEKLGKELWLEYSKKGTITHPDLVHPFNVLYTTCKERDKYYKTDRTDEIIRDCFLKGPEFAKYCKKSLENGFILKHLDDKNAIEGYKEFDGFEDYFPHYPLIFWKEEVNDFFEYSFIETKSLSKKIKEEYRQALFAILPKVDVSINMERFENHFATTSSLVPGTEKTVAHCLQAWKRKPQFPRKIVAKRCEVPIEPSNVRDTVILEPDGLFAVEVLAAKVLRILKHIPGSLMGHPNHELLHMIEKLERIGKKHASYGRDYKKEGLARPRELFVLTLEILQEAYPGEFDFADCFKHYEVIIDKDYKKLYKKGDKLSPPRGTGLGMMNEIVSLISLAIYEMSLTRIEKEIYPNIREKLHAGVWNDDSAFVGKEKYCEILRQVDIDVNEQLDYILNYDKTCILKNGVWILGQCASQKFDCSKDSLYRTIIWSKLHIKNVFFAKSFIRSMTFPDSVRDTVEEYIKSFPYEFYEDEKNQPAAFGGWVVPKKNGLDLTLESIDPFDISLMYRQYKASMAEKEKPSRMRLHEYEKKLLEKEFRGLSPKFNFVENELVENNYFDLSYYFSDADSMKKKLLMGLTMKQRNDDYWAITLKLRAQKYKKTRGPDSPQFTLINNYLEAKKGKLVHLPERYILDYVNPMFYIQDNFWYNKVESTTDDLELMFRAQCRIEKKSNVGIHQDLSLSDLKKLDLVLEPKANFYMPGTLPWHREISEDILKWCPNPFLYLNHLNREVEEIRFTKIPIEIDSRIKLPEKASYFFANEIEKKFLLYSDKMLDCKLSVEEAAVSYLFIEVDNMLYPTKDIIYTTPTHHKKIWSMIKKAELDLRTTSPKEICETYLKLRNEKDLKKISEKIYESDETILRNFYSIQEPVENSADLADFLKGVTDNFKNEFTTEVFENETINDLVGDFSRFLSSDEEENFFGTEVIPAKVTLVPNEEDIVEVDSDFEDNFDSDQENVTDDDEVDPSNFIVDNEELSSNESQNDENDTDDDVIYDDPD